MYMLFNSYSKFNDFFISKLNLFIDIYNGVWALFQWVSKVVCQPLKYGSKRNLASLFETIPKFFRGPAHLRADSLSKRLIFK